MSVKNEIKTMKTSFRIMANCDNKNKSEVVIL